MTVPDVVPLLYMVRKAGNVFIHLKGRIRPCPAYAGPA